MRRRFLTDEWWARLQPMLPPQKPQTGRSSLDHRLVLEAILWVLRTGAPWRDLPPEYGPWHTAATRFYRWVRDGTWARVLAELQRQADEEGDLDWHLHHVDGSTIRAHQNTAGARPAGQERPDLEAEALGRDRGGFSTKVHVRAEGGGKRMALLVSAGQRPEQVVLTQLMKHGAVKRLCSVRVAGDRGYSSLMVRRYLRRRGIGAVIPTRRDQRRSPRFDRAAYRRRNVVEWLINRLKQFRQFRRVATRYEKRAAN